MAKVHGSFNKTTEGRIFLRTVLFAAKESNILNFKTLDDGNIEIFTKKGEIIYHYKVERLEEENHFYITFTRAEKLKLSNITNFTAHSRDDGRYILMNILNSFKKEDKTKLILLNNTKSKFSDVMEIVNNFHNTKDY